MKSSPDCAASRRRTWCCLTLCCPTPTSSSPSPRSSASARSVVSASHPLAAQAGLRMMLKGGNAIDAAIAAAAALTVVEPVSNGLGSDNFAILWDGLQLHGLNSSGAAPAGWTPDYCGSELDLPQLDALRKHWRKFPPVSVILSHKYGIAKQAKEAEEHDQMPQSIPSELPAQAVSAEQFDELLRTMKLTPQSPT